MRKLTMALALAATVACGPDRPDVYTAGDPRLIVAYAERGGFQLAGTAAIAPPEVIVYSDGRVVARASRTLTLTPEELNALVNALRDQLAGHGDVESDKAAGVLDASTSMLTVRMPEGRLHTVKAYALAAADDYPDELEDARESLAGLTERTIKDGMPYRSETVRLVTAPFNEFVDSATPWPAGVDVPDVERAGVREADLTGAAAQEVMKNFPAGAWNSGQWPVYALPDGNSAWVAWRFVVPGEEEI
jgi:hypothetical protein